MPCHNDKHFFTFFVWRNFHYIFRDNRLQIIILFHWRWFWLETSYYNCVNIRSLFHATFVVNSISMSAWKMYTMTCLFWSRRWTRFDVWDKSLKWYRDSSIVTIDVFCKSWSVFNMSIVSKILSNLFTCICLSNFWFIISWNASRAWFHWEVFSKNIRVRRRA